MAQSHLHGSLALGLEDSGARMSRLGHSQLVHGNGSASSTSSTPVWPSVTSDDVDG